MKIDKTIIKNMIRLLCFNLIIIISSILTFGQSNEIDFLDKICEYDYSKVLLPDTINIDNEFISTNHTEPLGYFGDNYYRFYIHFISIIKDRDNPLSYYVYGKSRLKENISEFQGKITIRECRIFNEGDIPEYKQGLVIADYVFYENSRRNGSGKFIGKLTSNFYIDTNGNIRYDALTFGADGFENNTYEGNWISYKSKKLYKCNWGDYRIPDSNKLDQGAAEFSPSNEYIKNGWEELVRNRELLYKTGEVVKEIEWWN